MIDERFGGQGFIFLVAAVFVFPFVLKVEALASTDDATSTSAPVPTEMAGLPLSGELTGKAAIQAFKRSIFILK